MNKFNTDSLTQMAKETIDSLDHCATNVELLNLDYYEQEEDFPNIDYDEVLKSYCINFVYRILYEQANAVSYDKEPLFNAIETINQILNEKYDIKPTYDFDEDTDYLDMYANYTEFLDENYDDVFQKIINYNAEKLYDNLSKDDDFKQSVRGYFEIE